MPTLTVEQAKLGGARSVQVRRERKEELERLRARVAELELARPVQLTVEPSQTKSAELLRVQEQIERINGMIDASDDSRELDNLTRAKERLFKQWAYLAGVPGPGNLKPSSVKSRDTRPRIEPVVGPSCVDDTPTNGGS